MRVDRWLLVLAISVLTGCATGVGDTLKQPELLSAQQIRTLFVGNTVRSYNLSNKLTTWSYYRADGVLLQERLWDSRTGVWQIKDNGVVCLTVTHMTCKLIGRVGDRIYKYKIDDVGQLDAIIIYRDFVTGNPLRLTGK